MDNGGECGALHEGIGEVYWEGFYTGLCNQSSEHVITQMLGSKKKILLGSKGELKYRSIQYILNFEIIISRHWNDIIPSASSAWS